jgi:hypothetical protein
MITIWSKAKHITPQGDQQSDKLMRVNVTITIKR